MNEWRRIFDDEVAEFGNRSIRFQYPDGEYILVVEQAEQSFVKLICGELDDDWPIQIKEQRDCEFKLSGMAWATPEISMPETHWFELHICSNPKLTFWGDRVIMRTDFGSRDE